MFSGYYIWDIQEMGSDSHACSLSHSQSNKKTTSGTTAQVLAADETIPANAEGKSMSVKTFSHVAYTEEEILFFIGQLIDSKHVLHNIEQQH